MLPRTRTALLFALALVACSPQEFPDPVAPLDRFYFPIGVAVSRPDGVNPTLLVASSNFDLRYSATDGGTLLSVAPTATLPDGTVGASGQERIGSYPGPVAVADATTCSGVGTVSAMVASRFDDILYRFTLASNGSLSCGDGCQTPFSTGLRDPFAITLACGPSGRRAFVGFLQPPISSLGTANGLGAWIAELDLDAPPASALVREFEIGDGPVRSFAYDAAGDRLWIATRSSGSRALLYTAVLSDSAWTGPSPRDAVDAFDLFPYVRGAELRSLALSSGLPRRLYATARLYDADYQASTGNRPTGDVGGVLIVMDVDDSGGVPVLSVRRVVELGLGAGDVGVLSRAGQRDIVVAAAGDEGLVTIYDDEAEVVAQVLGINPATGAPEIGHRPVALAVDQPTATVYVTAFADHAVTYFSINPTSPWASVFPLNHVGGKGP
jgi:hypothetical protein